MKKIIQFITGKTIVSLLAFLIISKTSLAQQAEIKPDTPVKFETVILKFADINSIKVYSAVEAILSGDEGVSIKGRCQNADYLVINIDRRYYPKNDNILNKITNANFIFEVIGNTDVQKISAVCGELLNNVK